MWYCCPGQTEAKENRRLEESGEDTRGVSHKALANGELGVSGPETGNLKRLNINTAAGVL